MKNVSHTVPTFMDRTILETASGAFTSFQSPPELPGSNALDGSLETCTYSIIGDNPFWAVDFAKEMDVGEIQIRNTEGSGELHCIHAYYNIRRARQTGRHFAGDILKCIFMNNNIFYFVSISKKFVTRILIDDKTALVMEWIFPQSYILFS